MGAGAAETDAPAVAELLTRLSVLFSNSVVHISLVSLEVIRHERNLK